MSYQENYKNISDVFCNFMSIGVCPLWLEVRGLSPLEYRGLSPFEFFLSFLQSFHYNYIKLTFWSNYGKDSQH